MAGESTKKFPEFEIQIRDIPAGMTTQSAKKSNINASKEHFLKVAEIVEAAGEQLTERINAMVSKPSTCTVEFGLSLKGSAGIPLVTKGTIGTNFKVALTWQNKE